MTLRMSALRRWLAGIAVGGALAVSALLPNPAHAWWIRGGFGWGGVVVAAPPVYVAPPVVVAGPPPVVYAPPPRAPRWVPGHYNVYGYWVPGHWT